MGGRYRSFDLGKRSRRLLAVNRDIGRVDAAAGINIFSEIGTV
jgi:hypothetical protein